MSSLEAVVVVGSSGAGKSTLVDGLRDPAYEDGIVIPNRYITRPYRLNDNDNENTHISVGAFNEGIAQGTIVPYWMRPMSLQKGGRQEGYGFNVTADNDDRLRVYSANNAFLRHPNQSTKTVLEKAIVVVAAASLLTRSRRLAERSPDMSHEERSLRLWDDGRDILRAHEHTQVIDTTNLTPEEGQLALQAIIARRLWS